MIYAKLEGRAKRTPLTSYRMSILVSCPGCAKNFNVDDKFAGKTGKCPNCKTGITVPEKKPEVKIHTPEAFSSGGKTVAGTLALKPIARQPTRIKPLAAAAIGGGVLVAIVFALVVRKFAPEASAPRSLLDFQSILCGLGLLLVAPPLAIAAYTFLRDDELEPYRGVELYVRAGICGLIYALLWAVFAYVKMTVGPLDLPYWLLVVPPFLIVGGMAGKFSLDLETANGFFHYAFYAAVTILLGLIAGVSGAIWG
jgi:hypothetical protein